MADEDFVDTNEYDPFDPLDVERVEVKETFVRDAAIKNTTQYLERRQAAYQRMFSGASQEDREIVMQDLEKFTFGNDTVFHQDQRIHCLLTGRQEVYRRISDHLGLSFDALLEKYARPKE